MDKAAAVCNCQAGPAGSVSNYLAFGTGMDFMYTQLGVPYAITLEVFGGGGVGQLYAGATRCVALPCGVLCCVGGRWWYLRLTARCSAAACAGSRACMTDRKSVV